MSYLQRTLIEHETVVYQCRPHPVVFAPALGWLLIMTVILLAGPSLPISSLPAFFGWPLYVDAAAIALVIAVFMALSGFITYRASKYCVTSKRVIMKMGMIKRISFEIFLDKIESIHVDQTLPGRLLGYGQISVVGTGGSHDPFQDIPNPLEFRNAVQTQIERYEHPGNA